MPNRVHLSQEAAYILFLFILIVIRILLSFPLFILLYTRTGERKTLDNVAALKIKSAFG